MPELKKEEYLIIGGVTKAATTSLYHYFGAHPEVLSSTEKESNYWTDPDYNPNRKRHSMTDLTFEDCFPEVKGEKIKLDVTPNYLHSKGTAQRLKDSSIDFKMVFCLREPISRLISFYGFTRQLGVIDQKTTLDEFIEKLFEFRHNDDYEHDRLFRSLFEGKYWHYLQVYLKLFPGKVKVIFYEDLKNTPEKVAKEIAEFAGIDPHFYSDYAFTTFNKTRTINNKKLERRFHKIAGKIYGLISEQPQLYALGRGVKNKIVEPLIYWLNGGFKKPKTELSSQLQKALVSYYVEDVSALSREYDLPEAWKKIYEL